MKLKWEIILGIGIILIGIQFFQPEQNRSEVVTDSHFERRFDMPQNIKHILTVSCYDCHTNNTRYPWYSRIQPGAWFMAAHVKDGKEELNLSNFGEYSVRKQRNKLESMRNVIKDGEMPLTSYTWMHSDGKLSPEQKKQLEDWLEAMENKEQ